MNSIECTFSQIRQRKKDYLQQFNSTTIDYTLSNTATLFNPNEYKKIADALIDKNNKSKLKLQNILRRKTFLSVPKFNQEKINEPIQDQEYQGGFYITQNIDRQKKNTQESITSSQLRNKQTNSKQSINFSFLGELQQNKRLQQISDKICGQKSIFQTLSHQKIQTQNAINHFKKRIIQYQDYLNSQMLKQNQAEKVKMQNKQELFKTRCTNNQIKNAYVKTVNYFNKDFEGKANIKQEINKKNQHNFEEAAKRDIVYHKMRQNIGVQRQQLQQLQKYQGKISVKKKKVDFLMKRQKQYIEIAQAIFQIQKNYQKELIIQPLQLNDNNSNSFSKGTLKGTDSFERKNLIQITCQIIEYFQFMKGKQKKLIQQFKFCIDQKRAKTQAFLALENKLNQVIIFLSTPAVASKYQQIQNQSLQRISKIQHRLKMLSMCANAFQDRLKFYISKQFSNLHRVIELWLKNDKNAHQFICQFEKKLKDVFSLTKQEVCQKESRDLLEQFFQNSQNYKFYLEIINQNPFIFRYLNKSSLFNHLKRIVKTKIKNPHLCTTKIFEKSLEEIYRQSLLFFQIKSQQLLNMSKDIYTFLTLAYNLQTNFHHFVPNRESQEASQFPSRNELIKQEKLSEDYSDYVSFTIQDLKDFNRKSHLQQGKIAKQRLNPNIFFQKMKMGIQVVKIPLHQVKSAGY